MSFWDTFTTYLNIGVRTGSTVQPLVNLFSPQAGAILAMVIAAIVTVEKEFPVTGSGPTKKAVVTSSVHLEAARQGVRIDDAQLSRLIDGLVTLLNELRGDTDPVNLGPMGGK